MTLLREMRGLVAIFTNHFPLVGGCKGYRQNTRRKEHVALVNSNLEMCNHSANSYNHVLLYTFFVWWWWWLPCPALVFPPTAGSNQRGV